MRDVWRTCHPTFVPLAKCIERGGKCDRDVERFMTCVNHALVGLPDHEADKESNGQAGESKDSSGLRFARDEAVVNSKDEWRKHLSQDCQRALTKFTRCKTPTTECAEALNIVARCLRKQPVGSNAESSTSVVRPPTLLPQAPLLAHGATQVAFISVASRGIQKQWEGCKKMWYVKQSPNSELLKSEKNEAWVLTP